MPDQSAKTEQPTPKRLKKAREEGQYPNAREFVSALQFMVFLGVASAAGAGWLSQFGRMVRSLLALAFIRELGPQEVAAVAYRLLWTQFTPLLLAGAAVAAATLLFRLVTTRFGLSLKKLSPDIGRFNPLPRLRELPRQNLPSLAQAVLMMPFFLWAVWAIVRDKLETFLTLPLGTVEGGCSFLSASLMELFWKAAVVFLGFGAVDLFRQMRRHNQDLRMTKQEVREEMKDIEGNPQMKSRIRRLQRDRARRNMMKEVPRATAVIVNPTHYAVAIRYQADSLGAPAVVAKGKNYLALRIRQKAAEHQVPIIENPPVAQALYKSVDVGQEIPPHLYRAVAEILAYIFKLMNGRLPG